MRKDFSPFPWRGSGASKKGAGPLRGRTGFALRLRTGQACPLVVGKRLAPDDFPGSGVAPAAPFAEVCINPANPSVAGLKNLTDRSWSAVLPTGEKRPIEPGQTVRAAPGTRIEFWAFAGEIEAAASKSIPVLRVVYWAAACLVAAAGLGVAGWFWRGQRPIDDGGGRHDGRAAAAAPSPDQDPRWDAGRPGVPPRADDSDTDRATDAYNLAIRSIEQEHFDDALAQLAAAVRFKPDFEAAYRTRSEVYLSRGEVRKGLEDADKAVELAPRDALAYVNRSWARFQLNQFDRAEQDADQAIHLDGTISNAFLYRGVARASSGRAAEGVRDVYKALRLDPNNGEARRQFNDLAAGPLEGLFREPPTAGRAETGSPARTAWAPPSAEDERDLLPAVAGTPASPVRPAGGLNFNVLRYAILDAKAGTLTLIGESDPQWPTGPIPYLEHLQAASKAPLPKVSLETPESEFARVRSALSGAWVKETFARAGEHPDNPLVAFLFQANLGWGLEEALDRTERINGRRGDAARLDEMLEFATRSQEALRGPGLWLPPQFLASFGGLRFRSQVQFGELPTDSQMARALLQADYSLKLATTWAPLRRHVAGYLTFTDFCRGRRVEPGDDLEIFRWALEPAHVRLGYFDDGAKTIFSFAEPRLKVVGSQLAGKPTPAAVLDAYARRMTEQYDSLAHWFPALHEFREVVKVVALAEALRRRKAGLAFGHETWSPWETPETVPGVLSAVIVPSASPQKLSSVVYYEALGGCKIDLGAIGPEFEYGRGEAPPDYIEKADTGKTEWAALFGPDGTLRKLTTPLRIESGPPPKTSSDGAADMGRGPRGPPPLVTGVSDACDGDRGVWERTPYDRGREIEKMLGQNLPQNYPTIDRWSDGVATSIKSIDLASKTYLKDNNLLRLAEGYVDEVASFKGREKPWGDAGPIYERDIKERALDLVIPPCPPTAEQQAALKELIDYGRRNDVTVTIKVIK